MSELQAQDLRALCGQSLGKPDPLEEFPGAHADRMWPARSPRILQHNVFQSKSFGTRTFMALTCWVQILNAKHATRSTIPLAHPRTRAGFAILHGPAHHDSRIRLSSPSCFYPVSTQHRHVGTIDLAWRSAAQPPVSFLPTRRQNRIASS
jgi:hypothetical protein